MDFESMKHVMDSVHILRKIYSIVRILDEDGKEITYNNDGMSSENTSNESIEQNTAQSRMTFYTACESNAILSVEEEAGTLIIKITVPILINGLSRYLELIQHTTKNFNTSQLTAVKNTEQDVIFHHIKELTITDSLTKLYNRRYIDEQLPLELESCFEKNEPLSVIYADIDYFKKINDQYGHVAGDYVLKKIADVFRCQIRRKDGWTARYGGEEFLICLPEIDQKTAMRICHRIRRTIESCYPCIEDQTLKVTCSFGVQTVYKKSNIKTVDEIVILVDKKLYEAKKRGRNRVIG